MAYKFQFGTTRLSGSTTYEEALIAASTLSSSGVASLLSVTTDKVTAADCNIDGGAIDGTTIGATTQSSVKATTLSASSTLHAGGVVTAGNGFFTVSATGDVDINGGAIDGTTIGETTLSSVKATSLSASTTLHAGGVVTAGNGFFTVSATGDVDINGGAIDGTTIGATSATTGVFTSVTAPTLVGDMSGSGALDLMGAASFGNSRLVVNENAVLVTAPLHVSGTFAPEEAMTEAKLAQDGMLYFDSGSGTVHRSSLVDVAASMAGTGVTATNGVFSVDTTGGDSMTSTVIGYIAAANDGFTLSTGLNVFVDEVSGSTSLVLPSGSAGDVVIVKAAAGVSNTNFIKISSSLANGNEIDGFSQAIIESPHGAVSLIYSDTGYGQWVIY